MQLFVRGVDGVTLALIQPDSATVGALKLHLQAVNGIPACEQLLTAGGRVLLDGETLSGSGLQRDATVQLLLRLCGGKGGFGALLRGQGRDGKITDNFDSCRDLSGRRIRHVEAEKKLKEWEKDAKERELEAIAMKHMKEMAKQSKRHRDFEVNVEEVKRDHKQAAAAVAEAVHTALAAGLQQAGAAATAGSKNKAVIQAAAGPSSGSDASSSDNEKAAAAAAAAAADEVAGQASPVGKRKAAAAAAAGGGSSGSGSPAKKRKVTMMDMLDGGSEEDSDDSDNE